MTAGWFCRATKQLEDLENERKSLSRYNKEKEAKLQGMYFMILNCAFTVNYVSSKHSCKHFSIIDILQVFSILSVAKWLGRWTGDRGFIPIRCILSPILGKCRLRSKEAHRLTHWPHVCGLPSIAGAWLRAIEAEISAAL